jgi:putative transposase
MPRRPRLSSGGLVYHVVNRGVRRQRVFDDDGDYAAFLRVLGETCERFPAVRLVTFCLMPNHWHLLLWPAADGALSEFMRVLTVTHTQRWHAHRHTAGTGSVYQGRFKSCPIEADGHLLTVARYVERNAVRAGLAERAAAWPWGGAAARAAGPYAPPWLLPLDRWPAEVPGDWSAWVDRPETAAELEAVRTCVRRGRPFGSDLWQRQTADRLGLAATLRPRGRPRVRSDVNDSRPECHSDNAILSPSWH